MFALTHEGGVGGDHPAGRRGGGRHRDPSKAITHRDREAVPLQSAEGCSDRAWRAEQRQRGESWVSKTGHMFSTPKPDSSSFTQTERARK